MPSPDIQGQQQLVDQADLRMLECFEAIIGESLNEPRFMRLLSLMILWVEEYATLRRMQGDDGIRWARDAFHYHAAKVETLDRIAKKAKKAKTTDDTDGTEGKS